LITLLVISTRLAIYGVRFLTRTSALART